MDLYQFLNSADIREHLKAIEYRFSTLEAAWVISVSAEATMKQKHAAWRELINTMPDCPLPDGPQYRCSGSLHRILQRRIDFDRRMTELFLDARESVFSPAVYSLRDGWLHPEGVYAAAEEALAAAEEYDCGEAACYAVGKHFLQRKKHDIYAYFNADGELLSFQLTGKELSEDDCALYLWYEDFWFRFPTPFRKGDILRFHRSPLLPAYDGTPFVVERVNSDSRSGQKRSAAYLQKHGRYGDMTVRGFFQSENGEVTELVRCNYMDCEYYRGPWDGRERALLALQKYVRRELGADQLLNAYRYAMNDLPQRELPGGNAESWEEILRARDPARILVKPGGEAPDGWMLCRSVNQAKNRIRDCERNGIRIEKIVCAQELREFSADGGGGEKLLEWLKERGSLYSFELRI